MSVASHSPDAHDRVPIVVEGPFFKYQTDFRNDSETGFWRGCATREMRIEKTQSRERKWESLREATGKGHTSKALDVAADYYLRMRGGSAAVPTGKLAKLLETAEEQGSLTAPEIAAILNTEELPVNAEVSWSVGSE